MVNWTAAAHLKGAATSQHQPMAANVKLTQACQIVQGVFVRTLARACRHACTHTYKIESERSCKFRYLWNLLNAANDRFLSKQHTRRTKPLYGCPHATSPLCHGEQHLVAAGLSRTFQRGSLMAWDFRWERKNHAKRREDITSGHQRQNSPSPSVPRPFPSQPDWS